MYVLSARAECDALCFKCHIIAYMIFIYMQPCPAQQLHLFRWQKLVPLVQVGFQIWGASAALDDPFISATGHLSPPVAD